MAPSFFEEPPSGQQPTSTHVSVTGALHLFPRILSLDVLRGIAVLGALFVGVWAVGGFSANQQNGLLLQGKGWNYHLYRWVSVVLDGKMRALISLVFGAGMLLFLSKDRQKENLTTADLFIRRQLWLVAFGLINGLLLLWTGDVLFHLGIIGIILFPFVRFSARTLLIAALIATLIYSGKNYWNYADDRTAWQKYLAVTAFEKKLADKKLQNSTGVKDPKKDSLSNEQKKDKQAWEGIVNNLKYDRKKDDAEKKDMQAVSYGKNWNHLLPALQARESQWTYSFGIWDFAGAILVGMALFKIGFFSFRFSTKQYLVAAVACLIIGSSLGLFRLYYNEIALHDYVKYINHYPIPYNLFFPFERTFMAVGYTCLIICLIEAGILNFLWRSFAVVGRMTLTNYLVQSIVCTLFFAGFAMGNFGRLQQHQLYFFAAEVCLVQTVISILWLRHFQLGPVEWLWRCLTYGKWVSNKIRKTEKTASATPALS